MVYEIPHDRITEQFGHDNLINGLNNDQATIMRCLLNWFVLHCALPCHAVPCQKEERRTARTRWPLTNSTQQDYDGKSNLPL